MALRQGRGRARENETLIQAARIGIRTADWQVVMMTLSDSSTGPKNSSVYTIESLDSDTSDSLSLKR